jgi:hypothetical protein
MRSRVWSLPAVFAVFAGNYQRDRSFFGRNPGLPSVPPTTEQRERSLFPAVFRCSFGKGGIEIALTRDACEWQDL